MKDKQKKYTSNDIGFDIDFFSLDRRDAPLEAGPLVTVLGLNG